MKVFLQYRCLGASSIKPVLGIYQRKCVVWSRFEVARKLFKEQFTQITKTCSSIALVSSHVDNLFMEFMEVSLQNEGG